MNFGWILLVITVEALQPLLIETVLSHVVCNSSDYLNQNCLSGPQLPYAILTIINIVLYCLIFGFWVQFLVQNNSFLQSPYGGESKLFMVVLFVEKIAQIYIFLSASQSSFVTYILIIAAAILFKTYSRVFEVMHYNISLYNTSLFIEGV